MPCSQEAKQREDTGRAPGHRELPSQGVAGQVPAKRIGTERKLQKVPLKEARKPAWHDPPNTHSVSRLGKEPFPPQDSGSGPEKELLPSSLRQAGRAAEWSQENLGGQQGRPQLRGNLQSREARKCFDVRQRPCIGTTEQSFAVSPLVFEVTVESSQRPCGAHL